jgi:hypothetical protein
MRHPKKALADPSDGDLDPQRQNDQADQSNLDRPGLPPCLVAVGDRAGCALGVDAYERIFWR